MDLDDKKLKFCATCGMWHVKGGCPNFEYISQTGRRQVR